MSNTQAQISPSGYNIRLLAVAWLMAYGQDYGGIWARSGLAQMLTSAACVSACGVFCTFPHYISLRLSARSLGCKAPHNKFFWESRLTFIWYCFPQPLTLICWRGGVKLLPSGHSFCYHFVVARSYGERFGDMVGSEQVYHSPFSQYGGSKPKVVKINSEDLNAW